MDNYAGDYRRAFWERLPEASRIVMRALWGSTVGLNHVMNLC